MTLTSHMLLPDIQAQTGAALLPSNKKKIQVITYTLIFCLSLAPTQHLRGIANVLGGFLVCFFLNEQLYFH